MVIRLRFPPETLEELNWFGDLYDERWYPVEGIKNGSVYFRNNEGTLDAVRRRSPRVIFETEEDVVSNILDKYLND